MLSFVQKQNLTDFYFHFSYVIWFWFDFTSVEFELFWVNTECVWDRSETKNYVQIAQRLALHCLANSSEKGFCTSRLIFWYARVKSDQKEKQQIFLLRRELLYALEIGGYKWMEWTYLLHSTYALSICNEVSF